jgi:hypothetical protein
MLIKKCNLNLFISLQSSHSNAHSIFLLVSTTNKNWDYSYFSLCMYIDWTLLRIVIFVAVWNWKYWCQWWGIRRKFNNEPIKCRFELFKCRLYRSTYPTIVKGSRLHRISRIHTYIQICTSSKWHARRAAIEFLQNMIFCNLFNARSHAQRLRELVIQGLFDEQYEVRIAASTTLSGFYQCGYIQVTNEDLVGQVVFFLSLK